MSDVAEWVQQVASGLRATLAGFTQTTRLLRLHTPLGPDVLLAERLDGIETIDETLDAVGQPVTGYRLELIALSSDAHLSADRLLGHPVLLELLTDQGMADYRPFHGHVTGFEQLGSNGGFARYRLVIEPWLAFLKLRRDSYVFQDKSIIQIIDEVLGDYAGQGALQPVWRWQLADVAVYPPRSLCIQYAETDHDFVMRLLAEEGLFAWFEHATDQHTWVIGDRNDAFGRAASSCTGGDLGSIHYQRAAAMEAADTLQRFSAKASVGTQAVELASWDYASLDTRGVAHGLPGTGEVPSLTINDHLGIYRYPDREVGSRKAQRRIEGLSASHHLIEAAGTVRRLAPGAVFSLGNHPRYASLDPTDDRSRFAVVRVEHHARNNLPADFSDALDKLFSSGRAAAASTEGEEAAEAPLYRNTLRVHALTQPYAPLAPEDRMPGPLNRHRPRVRGSHTATVVGTQGTPVHTDRDHRIKVQFHFQRGGQSNSRLQHPAGDDNAPGNEASGTWVRVASPVAGQNWGGHFVPRLGQEVLVHFIDGDIDRPVVTGSLYNGKGTEDTPGNDANQTAPAHTPNAPAWFAGNAHNAVLSGLKTQALSSSQSGQGGYNHLLFDDTPGQSRSQLATTQHGTALTLGHHRAHENGGDGLAGNQKAAGLGHGASVVSQAYGAVRAGAGLLVTAHARADGTFASHAQMDAHEAISQLGQAQQLTQSLIDTAKSQQADLPAKPGAPSKAAVIKALETTQADLKTDADTRAWQSPHLIYSAPSGIAQLTAGGALYSAGSSFQAATGMAAELVAQGASRYHVQDGIRLFTYGSKPEAGSATPDRGLRLHSAAGVVDLQAQADQVDLRAKSDVRIASVAAEIKVSALKSVLMTAKGAYLKIEGDTVQLHAPGKVTLNAGQKVFTGPQAASLDLPELPKATGKFAQRFALYALEGDALKGAGITLFDPEARKVLWEGAFDDSGQTTVDVKDATQKYMALAGFDGWSSGFEDLDDVAADGDEEGEAEQSEEDGREEETRLRGGANG